MAIYRAAGGVVLVDGEHARVQIEPYVLHVVRRRALEQLDADLHLDVLVAEVDHDGRFDGVAADVRVEAGNLANHLVGIVGADFERLAIRVVEPDVDVALRAALPLADSEGWSH